MAGKEYMSANDEPTVGAINGRRQKCLAQWFPNLHQAFPILNIGNSRIPPLQCGILEYVNENINHNTEKGSIRFVLFTFTNILHYD